MRFHFKYVSCLLVSMLLYAVSPASAATTKADSDALLDLLIVRGVITAEEKSVLIEKGNKSPDEGFKAMVELLQQKGTISKDEADAMVKKSSAKPDQQKTAVQTNTPATGELNAVADGVKTDDGLASEAVSQKTAKKKEEFIPLPEDDIRTSLQILCEQGVLAKDESDQISDRIGKKWSPATEDDLIAVQGQEIEYNRTTLPKESLLADIAMLRNQKLITDDEAQRINKRFLQKYAMERVTDSIGENLQREVNIQVARKIVPIPEWTRNIKIGGDLRVRFRADLFDDKNGTYFKPDSNPLAVGNSTVDRYYTQLRARLNIISKINDEFEIGIGMATGNSTNPVSTNATLGDSLNKKNFLLDLAYLKWSPIKSFNMWGGRFKNPWVNTDLVWDADINFDGIAASWKPEITSNTNLIFTAGAFPIQEIELSGRDKWLYGGQIGINYKKEDTLDATFAASYYYFDNMNSVQNQTMIKGNTDWSRPMFMQKGNTVFALDPNNCTRSGGVCVDGYYGYASKFHELNLTAKMDYTFMDPYHVVLIGDYVNNLGYNASSVNSLAGVALKKETEGYQIGLSVGHAKILEAWKWRAMLNYKYLEADAVVDAFTDSDFHLGGTNAKGWITGVDLGVAKNVWFSTRWMTANEISGIPFSIDVFLLNLNARF